MASAFKPRMDEEYLSVNWLEYFRAREPAVGVQHVRDAFRQKNYRLRRGRGGARFAVIDIGSAKQAVREGVGKELRIDHRPLDNDPSHAGVHGYAADDLAVAVELKALVGREDVYAAVT